MLAFALGRLWQSIIVMITVALIAFSLFRFVGDPVATMVGQDTTPDQRAALREELGLNAPVALQFARYIGNVLVGDFGISYRERRPVMTLFRQRLPATLELVTVSAAIALVFGILIGVYCGLKRRGWLANFLQVISIAGVCLPPFLVGILLIYLFSVQLGWLPSSGRGQVTAVGPFTTGLLTSSGIKSIIMPALTLALFQMALIMRLVRSEMLEVLRTDFIKFARARGLPRHRTYFVHALKNTLVPVITVTGLQIGSLIAYSIVVETVFQWPGMGYLFLDAVTFVDIPVMSAYLLFVALMFVLVNLVSDLLYFAIDPRLRVKGSLALSAS